MEWMCYVMQSPSECDMWSADKVTTCYGLKNVNPVVKLGTSRLTKSRVLVCAPSNAALDEIVLRVIRHGLRDGAGNKVVPNIVRAGVAARMHSSIKSVTLEALVSQVVGESADSREVSCCNEHSVSSFCPNGFGLPTLQRNLYEYLHASTHSPAACVLLYCSIVDVLCSAIAVPESGSCRLQEYSTFVRDTHVEYRGSWCR